MTVTSAVAGLEIELPEGTPLEAVVILKYLDEDGSNGYWTAATKDLTTVEALGMTAFADVKLKQGLISKEDD
jgi:hypothetical protein